MALRAILKMATCARIPDTLANKHFSMHNVQKKFSVSTFDKCYGCTVQFIYVHPNTEVHYNGTQFKCIFNSKPKTHYTYDASAFQNTASPGKVQNQLTNFGETIDGVIKVISRVYIVTVMCIHQLILSCGRVARLRSQKTPHTRYTINLMHCFKK
jgi:hypothetical protein